MKKKKKRVWPWVVGAITLTGIVIFLNRRRVLKNLSQVQLTPNFNLAEFVRTSTGVENIPPADAIFNLKLLAVNSLQPLRDAVVRRYPGKKVAVIINSGYRSDAVNALVPGSAKKSQHSKGQAADLKVLVDGVRLSNQEIIDIIREDGIPYDQLIDEQRGESLWVHLSYSNTNNRREWLTRRDPGPGRPNEYEMVKVG